MKKEKKKQEIVEQPTEPAKMGRPTKYDPSMKAIVIELMGQGASKTEVAAKLGISKDTLWAWCDPEKPTFSQEFSDSIKEGEILSEAWWEQQGRENLVEHFQGPKLNATLWFMNMRNRFKWSNDQPAQPPQTPVNILISGTVQEMLEDAKKFAPKLLT